MEKPSHVSGYNKKVETPGTKWRTAVYKLNADRGALVQTAGAILHEFSDG